MPSLTERFVQLLDHVVPPRRGSVVLHSSPDVDDMVVALLATRPRDVDVTVLAGSPGAARTRLRDLGMAPVRVRGKRGVRGLSTYLRSAHSISTHGLFGALRRGRRKTSSTPWHGELSKPIGAFIGRPGKYFDHAVVSSNNSRILRTAEFGLSPTHVHNIGTPRQSTLLQQPRRDRVERLKAARPWVLFVPTYRGPAPGGGDARQTASPHETDMQVDLGGLGELVRRHGGQLWVRPHPLSPLDFDPASAALATDAELQQHGLTLYDVLAATDLLVTDYSSVWVDFLLLDKPLVGYCPDIDVYRTARGLALEPYDAWFPGPIARTTEELCERTCEVLAGHDPLAERRSWLRSLITDPRPDAARSFWSLVLDD